MREKIHYLKFCMSGSAGQAGHLASPLPDLMKLIAEKLKGYLRTIDGWDDIRSSLLNAHS